jgi:hypothetical protein
MFAAVSLQESFTAAKQAEWQTSLVMVTHADPEL